MAQPKSKEQAQAQPEQAAQTQAPATREGARAPAPARAGGERWLWRPESTVRQVFEDFERLVEDLERGFFGRGLLGEAIAPFRALPEAPSFAWRPRIEVRDTGRELVVSAELPGVDPEDVKIECTDQGLTLRGEIREEETREEGGIYQSERRYGSFFRQVPLPPELDLDKAQAAFRNGLLTITLPKTRAAQEKIRRIPIEAETGGGQAAGGRERVA